MRIISAGTALCIAATLLATAATAGTPFSSVSLGGRTGLALVSKLERANLGEKNYNDAIGACPTIGAVALFGIGLPIPGEFTWAPSADVWIKVEELGDSSYSHRFFELSLNPIDVRYYFKPKGDGPVKPFAGLGLALTIFGGKWETREPFGPIFEETYSEKDPAPKIFSAGANLLGGATIDIHEKVKPFFEIRAKLGSPRALRVALGAVVPLGSAEEPAAE